MNDVQDALNDWWGREMSNAITPHGITLLRNSKDVSHLEVYSEPSVYVLGWSQNLPIDWNDIIYNPEINVYKVGCSNEQSDLYYEDKSKNRKGAGGFAPKFYARSALYRRLQSYVHPTNIMESYITSSIDCTWAATVTLSHHHDADRVVKLHTLEKSLLGTIATQKQVWPPGNVLEDSSRTSKRRNSVSGQKRESEKSRSTIEQFFA
jgi:hypothetical protein